MTTTQTTVRDCWLVERCGDTRQVWGPYTEAQAQRESGRRHAVCRGGLSQRSYDAASLQALQQSGAVWTLSGERLVS